MSNTKFIAAIVLLGIIIGGAALYGMHLGGGVSLGSTNNQGTVVPNLQWFSGGIRVGDNNSSIDTENIKTRCNLSAMFALPIAATSTNTFICTVTGVKANDYLWGDLPQNAGDILGGFIITNVYATTTNQVAVTLLNLTGTATSSFAQATTSVEIFDKR